MKFFFLAILVCLTDFASHSVAYAQSPIGSMKCTVTDYASGENIELAVEHTTNPDGYIPGDERGVEVAIRFYDGRAMLSLIDISAQNREVIATTSTASENTDLYLYSRKYRLNVDCKIHVN